MFVPQTISPVEDIEWKREKRALVESAAHNLYHRLNPAGQMAEGDVFGKVTSWAFQVPPNPETHIGPSQTRFSLVRQGPRKSDVETGERLEKELCCFKQTNNKGIVQDDGLKETNGESEMRTVVRVLKRNPGNEVIRESEIDEETWRQFKRWMEENNN